MAYTIKIVPRSEREVTIGKRLETSNEYGEPIYDFRSGVLTPKVIILPIDFLVYRMENCRTFSAQQTEIAREGLDKTYFTKGQELTTAQQAQHEILAKLAKQGSTSVTPIISELEEAGQREALLVTSSGVVVNGNRRLAAMRELLKRKDGAVDKRFINIKCSILPSDVTKDEIDDIEADLQAKRQTKLDYDWIGDARLIRRQISKEGRSTKDVAERLRRSKSDIENVLQALDEADLYLSEWIEKPGQYDLVAQDGQQIFTDIPKSIAKKDAGLQNASRAIAWSIFENRDKVSGRLYRLNAAFGKLAPKVLDILEEQLDLSNYDEGSVVNDDFAVDIDSDDSIKDYTRIIQALRDDSFKDETIITLINACETAIELDKGHISENAALNTLSTVNSKVTGIDVSTAGQKTLPTMLKQIENIRKGLDKIEVAIKTRLGSKPWDTEVGK